METITGVVQTKRKDGKGVKINDDWYSSRNASFFASVNRNDTVTLQYSKNGTWNNCDENTAPVVSAAAPAASGGGYSGGTKAGGRASGFRDPDEIVRSEALKNALEFLSTTDPQFTQGSLGYKDAIERTLKTAELFSAYTKGLINLGASVPAQAPAVANPPEAAAPPPPPAPAPEPAPAPAETPVVGSALASFLE